MRHSGRWLTYRCDLYHFEPFGAAPGGRPPLWAVFRRGRMLGSMANHEREGEHQFVACAMRWLEENIRTRDEAAAARSTDAVALDS